VSALADTAGADPRLPLASLDRPAHATFLLLGSWVILLQGALIVGLLPVLVLSTKEDIPPGDIGLAAVAGALCLVAGALLYLPKPWTWWLAAAATLACAGYLLAVSGLTSAREGYAATALTGIALVFLVLGRTAAGNTEALALASARIPFRLKVGATWIAILLILVLFLALSDLDFGFIRDTLWYITKGLEFTILLAVLAIVLATILAILGSLGRLSSNPVAYGVSGFYTSFFRGTPLIVQLFLIYLALPQVGNNLGRRNLVDILTLTPFMAGAIGLGLNYGAYMTEIFRAGIQSVGHGQAEAADALGMTYVQRMRRVVLPQAVRVVIPPTGNEFIAMMKDTALVGILGVEVARTELLGRAQLAFSAHVTKRLETLLVAAALYWLLTSVFTFFQTRLEKRISKGYVRTAVSTATGRKRTQFIPAAPGTAGDASGGIAIDVDEEGR
jgi:polar amino acid transport system permease protein